MEFTQRTEFESYVFNAEHTVDVLVTLKAPRTEEEIKRSEICLSAALDRSGSMSGKKLELVKRTMEFVARQLGEDDKLGLVTYETEVQEVLQLMTMNTDGKHKGEAAIKKVQSAGSTNLSGGLFRSVQQIQDSLAEDDHGNPGPVRAVLLLTDGLANHGIVDSNQLAQTLKTMIERGPPIKIHTFGYGSDHNHQLLEKLSDIGEGNYYFIEKDDDVPASFADALGGLVSVVIQNAVLDITVAHPGATIEKVFTGMKKSNDNDKYKIQASDLYSEERKDIMVRLKLPAVDAPIDAEALLNFKLSYFDVTSAETISHEAMVCLKRPEVAPENQQADEDFLDQRLRIDVADVLENALMMGMEGDVDGAGIVLRGMEMRAMAAPDTAYRRYAVQDLQVAKSRCSSVRSFARGGGGVLRSAKKAHRVQKSAAIFKTSEQRSQTEMAAEFVMGKAEPTVMLPPIQKPAAAPSPTDSALHKSARRLSSFLSSGKKSNKQPKTDEK